MITLEAKVLKAAAAEAAGVAGGSQNTVPILGNVLIDADHGGARFVATDMDSVIERAIAAEVDAPLKLTVSARYLAAIAAKLPADAQVTLKAEDNTRLTIVTGRARFTLATLPAEDFPVFPDEAWPCEFEMAGADLAGLIDAIGFAISTEETRYYLNGIFLHAGTEGKLRAAATDGHRLARYQLELPEGAASLPEGGVIVPRRALSTIRKLIDHMKPEEGEAGPLQVAISAARIRVAFGESGTVFTSKMIDGTFPDYARVIPIGNEGLLKIDATVLKEAVDRVAAIASEKTRAVKFALHRDLLRLEVVSPEAGTAVEELPCDFGPATVADAGVLELGFNAKYLAELLGHIGAAEIAVELGEAKGPTLWRAAAETGGQDGLTRLYVLMPMRV